jgi:hypothetical protein
MNSTLVWKLLFLKKNQEGSGHQWLMPVILDTQEAEFRKITV